MLHRYYFGLKQKKTLTVDDILWLPEMYIPGSSSSLWFCIEDVEGVDSSSFVMNILLSFPVNNQNMKHHKGKTIWSWGGGGGVGYGIFCIEDVEGEGSSPLAINILLPFPINNRNMKHHKGRSFDLGAAEGLAYFVLKT